MPTRARLPAILVTGLVSALTCAAAATQIRAQGPPPRPPAPVSAAAPLRAQVERYVSTRQQAIVGELIDLLAIPNVAADRENIRKNAAHLQAMLARRGFEARVLETTGNPLVYGEMRVPGARRTLLFYAHYDGQPVNAPEWKQPTPFTPILRDRRLEDGGRELPDPGKRTA